jgi:hypothetical protein
MHQTLQSLTLPTTPLCTTTSTGSRKPGNVPRDLSQLSTHVRPILPEQNSLHSRLPIAMPIPATVRSMEDSEGFLTNVHEISVAWSKRALAMRGILQ